MKLERKWARICFALLVAAVACIVAPWLMEALLDAESVMIPITFGALALLFIGLEYLFSRKYLRCPNCGKSTAPPRWTNKNRYRCTRCATIFVFDDDKVVETPAIEDEYDEDEYDEEEYDEPEETPLKEEE